MGLFSKIKKFLVGDIEAKEKAKEKEQQKNCHVVKFSPRLIEGLESDHKKLFQKFAKIVETADNTKEFTFQLKDNIDDFIQDLHGHILIENRQLYTYLVQRYSDDPQSIGYLNDIQKNMNGIIRELEHFSKKYTDRENCNRVFSSLKDDLNAMAGELTKRIDMEEDKLYRMYIE